MKRRRRGKAHHLASQVHDLEPHDPLASQCCARFVTGVEQGQRGGLDMVMTRDRRGPTICVALAKGARMLGKMSAWAIAALLMAAANYSPAHAACTVVGIGTPTALNTGDVLTCLGTVNSNTGAINAQTNVTANIGDGSTQHPLNSGATTGVLFLNNTSGSITVFNQAAITADNFGIDLSLGSSNSVTVNAGGSVSTTAPFSVAIVVEASNNNTVTIGGTVGNLSAGLVLHERPDRQCGQHIVNRRCSGGHRSLRVILRYR